MELPFTVDQFMAVFAAYNVAVWPAQILLYAVALLAVLLSFSKVARDGWIATVLGFLWLWMGIAYHWLHFASINKAAYAFGALFVLQGLLFLFAGQRGQLLFKRPNGLRGVLGIALLLYALIIYPMLGAAMGHVYPNAPSFGLPCPTTIFTLGLLFCTTGKVPWWILAIPLLWSLIGFMAAIKLGIREDIGLLVAGAMAAVFLLRPVKAAS
jgi:hypothetical protein